MSAEFPETSAEVLRVQRELIRDEALARLVARFGRPPEYALEWARASIRREREADGASG